MKIYYIAILETSSGVTKKLINKVQILNELGLDTTLVLITNQIMPPDLPNFVIYLPYKTVKSIFNKPMYQNIEIFKSLDKYITTQNFDLLFFRYPLASRGLYMFAKKYKNKIALEHNTKEIDELENVYYNPYTLKDLLYWCLRFNFNNITNIIKKYITNKYILYTERYLPKKLFRFVKFSVCVTNEIAEYEKNRTFISYKTHLITNGINVSNVTTKKFIEFKDEINMVLMSGEYAPWHGTERLLASVAKYKGKYKINLFLVGKFSEENIDFVKSCNLSNVVFTGILKNDDLLNIIDKCHIGIGSMALYTKKMEEACPLKVREYLANGLPIMLGYIDPDLSNNTDFSPYFLQFSNDASIIDFDIVGDFVKKVYADIDHTKKIRELAVKYLDMSHKMLQLKNIILENV